MRLPRTPVFDEESARFALKFCCEDCGHFDVEGDACRHFWPTALHRRGALVAPELVFCKEFELC